MEKEIILAISSVEVTQQNKKVKSVKSMAATIPDRRIKAMSPITLRMC